MRLRRALESWTLSGPACPHMKLDGTRWLLALERCLIDVCHVAPLALRLTLSSLCGELALQVKSPVGHIIPEAFQTSQSWSDIFVFFHACVFDTWRSPQTLPDLAYRFPVNFAFWAFHPALCHSTSKCFVAGQGARWTNFELKTGKLILLSALCNVCSKIRGPLFKRC